MDVFDKERLRLLIKDNGALAVLKELRLALKECADEYSDLGIKERAYEAAEIAELLAEVEDVAGSGYPDDIA